MRFLNALGTTRASGLLACFLLTLLLDSVLASTATAALTTSNQFVSASVEEGSGHVTWYEGSSNVPPGSFLSYHNKSYLSLKINGQYYTNNDNGPSMIDNSTVPPDYYLTNGIVSIVARNGQNTDTVRIVWSFNNFDIVQDVYPVAFNHSGQIVLKVKIVNHSNQNLAAGAQFLLDVEVHTNDNPRILTRWDYSPNWIQYPTLNGSNKPVPPFYIAFENSLPPANGLGHAGTGFLNDSFPPAPMGLMSPNQMMIADWPTLVQYTWGGPPMPSPPPEYADGGILFQWPETGVGTSVSGDSVKEIARTSYGTGQFGQCYGNVFAILFYPDSISCAATKTNPPTSFKVLAMIFDGQSASTTNTVAQLTVGDSLYIVNPLAQDPPRNSTEAQLILPPTLNSNGAGVAENVGAAQWLIQAPERTQCSGDFLSALTLKVTGQGLIPPDFIDQCEFPITIGCCSVDIAPPVQSPLVGTGLFDSSFTVHDNSVIDVGLKDITWASAQLANFTISINPPKPITNCPKTIYDVTVHQIDSTKGGCIDFTFTDCASNKSYRSLCFPSRQLHVDTIPVVVKDTVPPKFQLVNHTGWPSGTDSTQFCYSKCDYFVISDSTPLDRGLRSIASVTANNMTLSAPNISPGQMFALFSTCVIDTMLPGKIVVKAIDTAGNSAYDSITYCPFPDTKPPIITAGRFVKGIWPIFVSDTQAWDRGIDSIFLTQEVNVHSVKLPPNPLNCIDSFTFYLVIDDTFQRAAFCLQAKDCAGNLNQQYCVGTGAPTDTYCPAITAIPALATKPDSIGVTVSDIHLTVAKDTINYDMGVDSVWFTNVHNMTLYVPGDPKSPYINGAPNYNVSFPAIHNPKSIGHPAFNKVVTFSLAVTDSTAIDTESACVSVNAVDGAGNRACQSLDWCYPISQDVFRPVIAAQGLNYQTINADISDNQLNDRGLDSVELLNAVNLQPPYVWVANGQKDTALSLKVITPGKSAMGTIHVTDIVGSTSGLTPQQRQAHETSANVAIYAQDLHMKAAHIILEPGDFDVPVYLDNTDSVPLSQKNISQYHFAFHLEGSNLITFNTPVTANTLSSSWNVTSTLSGVPGSYTITGIAPSNTILTDNPPTDTLLILRFTGALNTSPGMTNIVVDGTPGEEVSYNGGTDTTIIGPSSTVIQLAPYGHLEGGTVVIKGTCSPIITTGTLPTSISLAPTVPNPASNSTIVDYTIPEEGYVTLDLYDAIGQRVMAIVSEVEKQGEYRLPLGFTELPDGIYFLRLQSKGDIRSRRVILSR